MGFFDQFGDFEGYLGRAMRDVFPDTMAGFQPMPETPPAPIGPMGGEQSPLFPNAVPMPQARPPGIPEMTPTVGGFGGDAQAAQEAREAAALRMRRSTIRPEGDFQLGYPNATPNLFPPSTNMMPQPRPDVPSPQVPMPASDPRRAIAAGPVGPPMDISPPFPGAGAQQGGPGMLPPGAQPAALAPQGAETPNQGGGFLQNVLGLTPDRGKQIMAGIGKGMAGIQGPGALASFSRGAGTAIGGAQTEEHTQYGEKLKSLNAAINARKVGDMDAYKTNYLKYLGAKEQNKQDAATNKPTAWNKPPAQRFLDAQRLFTLQQKQLYNELGLSNKDMRPDDRTKALTEYTARSAKLQGEILSGVGLSPQEAANMAKTPPGTSQNPHSPMSKQDFDSYVKPGQYFKNPRDGKVYMRKTGAEPEGKVAAQSARPDEAPAPFDPGVPGSTGMNAEPDLTNAA